MRFDLTRTLYAGAIVFAVAGLILRMAPTLVPSATAPGVTIEPPARELAAALTVPIDSFQPIVADNVFDQQRTPPESRYVPPELAAAQPAPQPPQARPAPRGPRLFGVAVGPTGAVALIDADPSIPGAEVYREGDLVAGARLIQISDTAVVLEGPAGRRVLTLPSSSRRTP